MESKKTKNNLPEIIIYIKNDADSDFDTLRYDL